MNAQELIAKIQNTKSTFASFETSTSPKFKAPKTNAQRFLDEVGCAMEDVRKISKYVAFVGNNVTFQSLIESRSLRDDKTQAQLDAMVFHERAYGENDRGIVEHDGKIYIVQYFFEGENSKKIHHRTHEYVNVQNGQVLNKEVVSSFLYVNNSVDERQEGNEYKIRTQNVTLTNVIRCKIGGEEYVRE